jgi:CubicO group peptidase (beta-lactamase class C family)
MQDVVRPAKMNGGKNTNPLYGYHTWLLSFRGSKVFYARGILGQYIFCIPQKNLVIVRLGHKRSPIKLGDHPVDAYTYIRTAISLTEQN